MKEIGQILREVREGKGLSLEEVSEQTKIRTVYLRALEDEDFERLPGKVYTKGFLRSYAIALGINPDDILKHYQDRQGSESEIKEPVFSEVTVISSNAPKSIGKILIIILILAIVFAGFFFVRNIWFTIKNETIPQLLEPEEENQSDQLASNNLDSDGTTGTDQMDSSFENSNTNVSENPSVGEEDSTINSDINQSSSMAENTDSEVGSQIETLDASKTINPQGTQNNESRRNDTASNIEKDENKTPIQSSSQNGEPATSFSEKEGNKASKESSSINTKTVASEAQQSKKNPNPVEDSKFSEGENEEYLRDEERWELYAKTGGLKETEVGEGTADNQSDKEKDKMSMLQIIASGSSWVRVSADGEVIFQGVMEKGDTKIFEGHIIQLRVNNAEVITVNYKGIPMGPFGGKNEFVEKVFGE